MISAVARTTIAQLRRHFSSQHLAAALRTALPPAAISNLLPDEQPAERSHLVPQSCNTFEAHRAPARSPGCFGDRTVPRIEGILHYSERQRLLFNYFRFGRDIHHVADRDLEIDGLVLPAGSEASAGTRFKLGTLVFDYALAETPTISFGLQTGAAWGAFRGRIQASSGPLSASVQESRSGFAPVFGARFAANTADRTWSFVLQGQYVNANWANLDRYSGDLTRINALVEYRFSRHLGIHAGYDAFRLNINRDFNRFITAGAVLRFSGPLAGLTLVL